VPTLMAIRKHHVLYLKKLQTKPHSYNSTSQHSDDTSLFRNLNTFGTVFRMAITPHSIVIMFQKLAQTDQIFLHADKQTNRTTIFCRAFRNWQEQRHMNLGTNIYTYIHILKAGVCQMNRDECSTCADDWNRALAVCNSIRV
jgi:hypothetical protein